MNFAYGFIKYWYLFTINYAFSNIALLNLKKSSILLSLMKYPEKIINIFMKIKMINRVMSENVLKHALQITE